MSDVAARKRANNAYPAFARSRRQPRALNMPLLMLLVFAAALAWLSRDLLLPGLNGDQIADIVAPSRAGAAAEALGEAAYASADTATTVDTSVSAIAFSLCHTGGGQNCVVDGDTFWLDGEKIRIADIDTPETHPPRCQREAELGAQATVRLQQLLNAGTVTLAPAPSGDNFDRYGRRLAVVERGGASIGMMLVNEGLARPYSGGRRAGWC